MPRIPVVGGVPALFLFVIPVVLLALVVLLVLALRWFSFQERMAVIRNGMGVSATSSSDFPPFSQTHTRHYLAKGVMVALIGLAISIGLFTIGITPWLLLGLIPLFVGLAMILAHLITLPNAQDKQDNKAEIETPVFHKAIEPERFQETIEESNRPDFNDELTEDALEEEEEYQEEKEQPFQ